MTVPERQRDISSMTSFEPSPHHYKRNAISSLLRSSCNGTKPLTHIDWECIAVHWAKSAHRFQGRRHRLAVSAGQMCQQALPATSGKTAMTTAMLERTPDLSFKQPGRKKSVRPRSSALSKNRTDFGVEANSRSPHFHGAVKQGSKRYPMPLHPTLDPVRGATRQPGRNATLRRLVGLLRRWRERAHSRRRLCKPDDHILQDIGPTRDALLREITMPFWQ